MELTHSSSGHSKIKKETEGLVMAAQNQAISTNCIKVNICHHSCSAQCRLCGSNIETIDHILSSCTVIAQSHYKQRHGKVARIVHWKLPNREDLLLMISGGLTNHFQ